MIHPRKYYAAFLIFAGAAVFSALSCKPALLESSLAVTVGPKPAFVLPVALDSCKNTSDEPDLLGPAFDLNNIHYIWNGTGTYKMAYIQVLLRSGLLDDGKYECIIAGKELAALLNGVSEVAGGDTTEYSMKPTCGIRCGSVNISKTVSSAYITGTAKFVGTETDEDRNQVPVVTEVEIAVQYIRP